MADVLEGDRYAVATSLTNISLQLAQVVGFLAAGALVAALNPSAALLDRRRHLRGLGALAGRGLQRRPAPLAEAGEGPRSLWQDTGDGLRLIARSPRLLAIIGRALGRHAVRLRLRGRGRPAGRASSGSGATAIGVLLAANPLGVTIGGLVIARLVAPGRRERLVVPLVVLSLAPLLGRRAGRRPRRPGALPFAVVVALLFVSGLGASWLIPLNVLVRAGRAGGVPRSRLRGRGQRALRRPGARRAAGRPGRRGRCRPAACSPLSGGVGPDRRRAGAGRATGVRRVTWPRPRPAEGPSTA